MEARERFAAARVARLATSGADGVPHLVPVVFAVEGDALAFAVDHKPKRSADLRRLRNIAANPCVCLLADHYEDDWTRLWWARADGRAEIVAEPGERARWVARLAARYPQYIAAPPEGPVVVVAVERWSGWSYDPFAASTSA
ncbi:TIGR03668 family PPOX class F420-dependent oxidoreductase [Nonomuraea longicatena]|uniref:TIGR03668 family PPOX class F420-dependent oxidoreductase n=1 Tax=Nonomuraea longicatena TaxID=83682 RepID=A0ABN1RAD4_9ACTN